MDMGNEQLKEALEHDVARKQAESGGNGEEAEGGAGEAGHQTMVATEQLVDGMDIKNSCLAKVTSMTFIDFARSCCTVASTAVAPAVDLQGEPKGHTVDTKKADLLLGLAERAVMIARELDVLGDKNILRVQGEAPKTEQ